MKGGNNMTKLENQSRNTNEDNIKKIQTLFPDSIVEVKDSKGQTRLAIDFNILKQDLSDGLIDEQKERYCMTWPDKSKSILLANSPTSKTLRPVLEKSQNFYETKNLYIEGDNLEALKILSETYLNKIDVIYIDPPYNTGKNLIYKNDFSLSAKDYLKKSGEIDEENNQLVTNTQSNGRFHTDWLNMMNARLRIAKNFLSNEGIIVITIDDCEVANLIKLCDEIFGEENHLATIVIKNNPSGRSTVSGVSISHEYALFYGANPQVTLGRLERNDLQIARYKEKDSLGQFEWVNFRKHGGFKEDAPSMFYPIYIKNDGSDYRIPSLKWDDSTKEYSTNDKPLPDEFVSLPFDENGRPRRWKWGLERLLSSRSETSVRKDKNNQYSLYIKARMNDEGMLPLTVWDDKKYSSTEYGNNYLIDLFGGKKYFDYPKSIYAVMDCLKVANVKKNSIVMDFFSGSGTTGEAVEQLNAEDGGNRRFILIQVPEANSPDSLAYKDGYKTICDIGQKRLQLCGAKINSKTKIDDGYRVVKVDTSNMIETEDYPINYRQFSLDKFVSNVKEDRSAYDLLFSTICKLGIELSSKIVDKVFSHSNKKYFLVNDDNLVACFADSISIDEIQELANYRPLYAVFVDRCFSSDEDCENCEQVFKTISPTTILKIL